MEYNYNLIMKCKFLILHFKQMNIWFVSFTKMELILINELIYYKYDDDDIDDNQFTQQNVM